MRIVGGAAGARSAAKLDECPPASKAAISQQGCSEVVNDIHRELMNFWKVLQNPATFEQFRRRIEATPFSRNGI